MQFLIPLLPAALSFGPIFIVMGLASDMLWLAYAGALALSFANVGLFALIGRALREQRATAERAIDRGVR